MMENCCKCWMDENSSLYGGVAKRGAMYFAKLPGYSSPDNNTAKNSLDMGFLDAVFEVTDEFSAPKNTDSFISSVDTCFVPGPNATMVFVSNEREVKEILNQIFKYKNLTKAIEAKNVKTKIIKDRQVYILE